MNIKEEIINRNTFNEVIIPIYNPYSFIPVKGKGSRLWDQKGKDYIDFSGGIAVSSLGHCHPLLIKTLRNQSKKLWHTGNIFTNEPALRLAKKLISNSFASRVFFANSGAEANESAFKLARYYTIKAYNTNKIKIVSFYNGFHGRTLFTVSVGGQSKYSDGFGSKITDIIHVPFNNIEALEAVVNYDTCAIVIELIQGEGGVVPVSTSFLKSITFLCDKYNVLLIIDEIQTGIGRTGKLFAYEYYNIKPDMLTLAKGLGGGFPISAMLTTEKIAACITPGIHGTTYGGNLLACSLGETILDIVNTSTFLSGVTDRHKYFLDKLKVINHRFKLFSKIRGKGLLIGLVLVKNKYLNVETILNFAASEGVILLTAGKNVIRLAPSLIIKKKDINEGLQRFERALDKYLSFI